MTEMPRQYPRDIHHPFGKSPLDAALRRNYWDALSTDSYETASAALSEVTALRQWRLASRQSSFAEFYGLFESVSAVNRLAASPEHHDALTREVVDMFALRASRFSPRVRDLYLGVLSEIDGMPYQPEYPMTQDQLTRLRDSGDLAVLQDPNVPFELKLNRMNMRVESELRGRKALDRRDREQEEASAHAREGTEEKPDETMVPPARDESKPGMDERERLKEGEQPGAIWTITPAYGGYFKEQCFDTWDSRRNTWTHSDFQFIPFQTQTVPVQGEDTFMITGRAPVNQWIRIPIPYTHELVYAHSSEGPFFDVRQDENGDIEVMLKPREPGTRSCTIDIQLKKIGYEKHLGGWIGDVPQMPATFSEKTMEKISEVREMHGGDLQKARALAAYTKRHLTYSNDSSYNNIYAQHPDGYFAAIDEHRQADCDVANTYFAALCAQLGIPVKHVVGHMVQGKDENGSAQITRGTGHAWSEIWDKEGNTWVRIDSTPAGDQQMEEQQNGEGAPGDYDSEEAVGPTDAELIRLEKQLTEVAEKLSYTSEERELAKQAGIELKEAREIMKEINKAEDTRLPNGERVSDAMAKLFQLIIDSRQIVQSDYAGPVRRREGGEEIENLVAHAIGIRSGDLDPISRTREIERVAVEELFGGFDVYLIGDKSGSMNTTVNNEEKWKIQRRMEYLIFSSLHRFEQNIARSRVRMLDPLSVRSMGISFRNTDDIDEDKPLSGEFSATDKVTLWKSLGNQGAGNGDVAALKHIHTQISEEHEQLMSANGKDDRLRIVIACSDGAPDSVTGVHQMAEELGKLQAVVVGIGMTKTAAQVPVIFNTPHSVGDIAEDIRSLPRIVAKHVIATATRLFPERSKKSIESMLATMLRKFDTVP